MPTYSIQVTVNVPGVGSKVYTATGIVAAGPSEAMTAAIAQLPIRITGLTETAP